MFKANMEKIVVDDLKLGHSHNRYGYTGTTVLLFEKGAVAGAYFCGSATSTRQADGLRVDHVVQSVNAFLFTGGSAFGLDATGGVLKWLEERKQGLNTRYGIVPVCPTAAIYDIGFVSGKIRPDALMAYEACQNAKNYECEIGSVGAGTGATVGKLLGIDQATKGGFGTAYKEDGDLVVQVFVVNNGFGDVKDYRTGNIIAGARCEKDSSEFADIMKCVEKGKVPNGFFKAKPENTVLMAVVTNACFNKTECTQISEDAVKGLKKVMSPALAPMDGDVIFTASSGQLKADIRQVGEMAADCIADALISSVVNADGFGIIKAYKDIKK